MRRDGWEGQGSRDSRKEEVEESKRRQEGDGEKKNKR